MKKSSLHVTPEVYQPSKLENDNMIFTPGQESRKTGDLALMTSPVKEN